MNDRIHIHTILSGLLLAGILLMGCAQAKKPAAEPSRAPEATAAPAAEETYAPVAVETAAPTDLPEEAEAAEPQWVGTCHSLLDELPYAVDLDLDGRMELIDLRAIPGADEYPRWAIVLTKDGEERLFQTEIPYDMPHDLWLGDLNEDGAYELFFHGDMASDDYLIYALHLDLTPILFEPDDRYAAWIEEQDNTIFGGYIDGFEDDHIVIEGVVDMLGTHFGVRNFAIGDDGVIGSVSSVWAGPPSARSREKPLPSCPGKRSCPWPATDAGACGSRRRKARAACCCSRGTKRPCGASTGCRKRSILSFCPIRADICNLGERP